MNKDCSYDEATNLYDDMLKAFKTSRIRPFNEFAWRDEISNSYLRPYDDRNYLTHSLNNSLHSDSVPKRKRGTYKKIRD